MQKMENIIICSTELSSKQGKIPFFPHILVDHLNQNDIPYTKMSLIPTGGDYVIQDQRIVIERKTVADFLGSWLVGSSKGKRRIEEQLDLMIRSYEDCRMVLMIEDYYRCIFDYEKKCIWIPRYDRMKKNYFRQMGFSKRKVNPKSFKGKLRSLSHKFKDLEIVKCSSGYHALSWFLEELKEKKEKKKQKKTIQTHRVKRKSKNIQEQRLFFLEGLPNLGGATSQKLLDEYDLPIKAIEDIDNWRSNPNLRRILQKAITKGKEILGVPKDSYIDEIVIKSKEKNGD
jgi:ERCC4-type nuclease